MDMTHIEPLLSKLVQKIARDEGLINSDIKLKPFSTDGANYSSCLYFITIATPNKELKLFAKAAILSEKVRLQVNIKEIFGSEEVVYKQLTKIYETMQDTRGIPVEHRYVFPKFYACHAEFMKEILILEDLSSCGFTCYDRLKSIDWEYASKSVECLANWHALSYCFKKLQPQEFNNLLSTFKLITMDEKTMLETEKRMKAVVLDVIDERFKEKFQKILKGMRYSDIFSWQRYEGPRRVLVHGDYRASNLMHREQNGKLQVIPVDYQTIHAGCPLADLIYFIFTGSDQTFRKRHYHDLIQHYHDQLGLSLKRLGLDIEEVYPRDSFDAELKEVLPFGLLIGVFVLPIVTVEAENAPSFDDNSDYSEFAVKPSELFIERFNGIVEDMAEWGVL